MLRCIAIDDEPLALDLLEDNISMVPYLQLVARCNNAFEAIQVLQQQAVDLIFLDIQMPGLTGLQFLQSMAHKPMVILITAYEKYALQGFNLDVTDYLVKPVSLERFIKACNKAWELWQLKSASKGQRDQTDFFFVNVDYSLLKVVFSDIIWIEGLKDYVRIYLKSNHKPVVTRVSIKGLEEQLPSGRFIRIHKSYIVAISSITAIRKNSIFLDELELPVGDTFRESLQQITGKSGF
ncbi:LytR/AlgR family response regulator transcription factor [Chitinophaga vietnamensis]|uniref:LytR/AlgR family response regulator transcription factor n=1 Tax=Chitinophaga vietnamensis TaxID=2593957 RepID=UPI001177E6FA|nr:LytTR family DNA-binding domain-containing protein [Chitinophaga vietnamensis]